LSQKAVENGLLRLRWPGRFEMLGNVVLDGAHNGASAAALAQTLGDQQVTFVIGINRDKDARAVLRPLLPLADRVFATVTRDNPRALPAEQLARLCRRLGARTQSEPSLERALQRARESARGIVCVTGSLMLVGQVRAILGVPPPERLWDG
jgi:dihydrofolate synthase / folylpolyglutamate synthase